MNEVDPEGASMPLSFTILLTIGVFVSLVLVNRRSKTGRPNRHTATPTSHVVVRKFGDGAS
jgi:hypothetical protein